MAANLYCTVSEIKNRLGKDTASTDDDASIEAVISAVSRWIDRATGRRFYTVSEARSYSPEFIDELFIDDAVTITKVESDDDEDGDFEKTWNAAEYQLRPRNAQQKGRPYTSIVPMRGYFHGEVRVTGSFGYSTQVPPEIQEAAAIQALRIYKRKDSPFGIAGSSEVGEIKLLPKLDVDVVALIEPFKRLM